MKPRLILLNALLAITTIFMGCANPGIVKMSQDTYMLSRTDKGGVFGNASAMKADVIREANEFAASKGKVAVPISLNESPMFIGHFASVDYQFRIVDPSDPAAQGVSLAPRPNVVIEKTEKTTVDVKSIDQTARPKDVYGELIKLDDLRKRGIISQEEFDVQKKNILEGK
jgi:hypothetical protein